MVGIREINNNCIVDELQKIDKTSMCEEAKRMGDKLAEVSAPPAFVCDDLNDSSSQLPDGFSESVAKLIDKDKVIVLEKIDEDILTKRYVYRFAKRVFDIVSCSIAVVLCAVPMLWIAYKVKQDSPGPVFYRQERLGLNGKPFYIVKFRSMYVDAESGGAQWAEDDDPRVTPFGRKIRANRLDEIPQFFGVIKGDLSLVGPRPERKIFYDEFEKNIKGFSQRLYVKPGLTGLAQVNGGYDLLPEEKILYDLEYIKNCSLMMDWKLVWKTVAVMLSHDGAR